MAAKQQTTGGLTAHISQASEDAKRWGRTWLPVANAASSTNSNLVCTIKSAPPRSPAVLNLLATKSGWLYKRNEQHVWQARWCCVVPHMFLYYFDAAAAAGAENHALDGSSGSGGGGDHHAPSDPHQPPLLPQPSSQQQEEWNQAVWQGLGTRHEKRGGFGGFGGAFGGGGGGGGDATTSGNNHHPNSSLPMSPLSSYGTSGNAQHHHHSSHHNHESMHGSPMDQHGELDLDAAALAAASATPVGNWQQQQPAGIIDLECYTLANRSTTDNRIWELAGDDATNPDLRPFYFLAVGDQEDSTDEWTAALLQNRHASLTDEVDAYKQVCDGFAQQLQQLHQQLDAAAVQQEEAAQDLYRVRSHQEDIRRQCWRIAEERLLQNRNSSNANNAGSSNASVVSSSSQPQPSGTSAAQTAAQEELVQHLERLRTQDWGVTSLVQVVVEYTAQLEAACRSEAAARQQLERQWEAAGQTDAARVQQLTDELAACQAKLQQQEASHQEQLKQLQAQSQAAARQLQDVQKELASTKLEMTMHASQQRNKLATTAAHKKILKKEVLDLRGQLDTANKTVAKLQQAATNTKLVAAQEQQKNELLERYVEKMESQVKVQQNMMEMMSASGSVYGPGSVRGGGSVYGAGGGGSVYGDGGSVGVGGGYRGDDVVDGLDVDDDDDDDKFDDRRHRRNSPSNLPRTPTLQPRERSGGGRGAPNSMRRYASVDPDADNKSHVSELTEDRTQRHFEAMTREFVYPPPPSHHHHHSYHGGGGDRGHHPSYPPRGDSGRMGGGGSSRSARSPKGPPAIIIGVNNNNNEDDGGLDSEMDTSPRHSQQQRDHGEEPSYRTRSNLDTIQSSASSLPPSSNSVGGGSPYTSGAARKSMPPRGDSSISTSDAGAGMFGRRQRRANKLSVAQRARMEAELKTSNKLKARLDEKTKAAVEEQQQKRRPSMSSSSADDRGDPTATTASSSHNASGTSLWRKMEEAVLGPRSDSDDDDDDDDGASSFRSTRVTDYTDTNSAVHQEEKKVGDNDSSAPSTPVSLQERSRLQRAKQLQFLREQGLIRNDEDVKGGAGADSASVASSGVLGSGNKSVASSSLRSR